MKLNFFIWTSAFANSVMRTESLQWKDIHLIRSILSFFFFVFFFFNWIHLISFHQRDSPARCFVEFIQNPSQNIFNEKMQSISFVLFARKDHQIVLNSGVFLPERNAATKSKREVKWKQVFIFSFCPLKTKVEKANKGKY